MAPSWVRSLLKSSGVKAWDEAVLKAIAKTEKLPLRIPTAARRRPSSSASGQKTESVRIAIF
jgi:hypothetical protein